MSEEGTTIYCGDNCNHTGPHRYPPPSGWTGIPTTPPASETVEGWPEEQPSEEAAEAADNALDRRLASETVEAAWEALEQDVYTAIDADSDRMLIDAHEKHRPRIEAAIRAEADERVRALREAAATLVRAYDAHNDALNGEGHKGEPHNRDLWQRMPGDVQVYDQVGDCSACGGAQYGTEDAIQQAIVDVKVAIGEPLRPYEEFRAALDATPEDAP